MIGFERAVIDEVVYELMQLSGQEYVDIYAASLKNGAAHPDTGSADAIIERATQAFRHIKEATGLTPDNYLKRLRLVSARVKLRETDMTITEVAYLCGFANSNHFTTLYKKVFGLTPSADRRRPPG